MKNTDYILDCVKNCTNVFDEYVTVSQDDIGVFKSIDQNYSANYFATVCSIYVSDYNLYLC